jgi:two-component system, NarL family, sensor histidine kinase DesK
MSDALPPAAKESRAGRISGLIWAAIWMWPLLEPAGAVFGGKVHPAAPAAAGFLAFAVLYLAVVLAGFGDKGRGPNRRSLLGLAVLAALGITLVAGYGRGPGGWLQVLLYVGAAGAAVLRRRAALGWIAGTVALVVAFGLAAGQAGAGLAAGAFTITMACALVVVVKQMMGYIHQLHRAQAELADAAVAEERLRFARDLHDLLGHTLSVIVVKAEVIRRLTERDPAGAAAAARDIEQIGRTALTEVREAVTGYRDRPFAAELDGARGALADAGIEVTVEAVGTPLPAEADSLFGWAVREGATNVIRHSKARHCAIVVRRTADAAVLEIHDDGVGGFPAGNGFPAGAGHGLRGLSERLAAAGGSLRADTAPEGGFRLVATLPATA